LRPGLKPVFGCFIDATTISIVYASLTIL
jgi:hypothetical protein